MSKKVRLGIIGFGTQGSTYANFIKNGLVPNMEIGSICDSDLEKKRIAEEEYPTVPFYDNYVDMLESGHVDAIITTVPHYLHPEMGIEALKRDIHALLEKPAGVYTKQVKTLNDYAKKKPGVTFGIMFNQRNNPLYKRIKEIVDNGEIGKIRRTNWIITTWWRPQPYYDQSEWRATWGGEGGGVLVNQAPHQLDLWQWICGIPKSVYSKVSYGYKRDIAVEDEVTAVMDYGDGATGVFVTATHDITGTDRFEILGDQGKIVVENSQKAFVTRLSEPEEDISSNMEQEDVKKLFKGEMNTDDFYTTEEIEFDSAWGEQHSGVLKNFAAHILDGTPLLAPGSEGINGVRLANAIHLSSWTDKEVSLENFDEDTYLIELNKRIQEEGKYSTRKEK